MPQVVDTNGMRAGLQLSDWQACWINRLKKAVLRAAGRAAHFASLAILKLGHVVNQPEMAVWRLVKLKHHLAAACAVLTPAFGCKCRHAARASGKSRPPRIPRTDGSDYVTIPGGRFPSFSFSSNAFPIRERRSTTSGCFAATSVFSETSLARS